MYKCNIIYTMHCKKVAEMPEKYNGCIEQMLF